MSNKFYNVKIAPFVSIYLAFIRSLLLRRSASASVLPSILFHKIGIGLQSWRRRILSLKNILYAVYEALSQSDVIGLMEGLML